MRPYTTLAAAALGLSLAARPSAGTSPAPAGALVRFDLRAPAAVAQWSPTHDIASLTPAADGMRIAISGSDPYTTGPPRDLPSGVPLWLTVRLRSEEGGMAQVFYFREASTEAMSVRWAAPKGSWSEARLPLPPLGPGYRLRLDPPGAAGTCTVAWIALSERRLLRPPAWPRPTVPRFAPSDPVVRSGAVALRHAGRDGAWELRVDGVRMAVGNTRALVGYLDGSVARWFEPGRAGKTTVRRQGGTIVAETIARDPGGATWTIRREFGPARVAGGVHVTISVRVSRDRLAVFVPLLLTHPGAGSFGAVRDQGLFAGLEYLERPDKSSSEADIVGPGARRQVPDTLKVTMPLMVIQAAGRWVGLQWTPAPDLCPVFDSPDRLFGSGAHVMGLLFPGSNGKNREEGALLPYDGVRLAAGRAYRAHATLTGGVGHSVVPSVQDYVKRHPLPPVPRTGLSAQDYLGLAAAGWLDSGVREGNRYRHAYWPGVSSFGPMPAADAAVWMDWIAAATRSEALASRLRPHAAAVLAEVPPDFRDRAGVSHVRYPVPSLVYGDVQANARAAADGARAEIARFEPDGTLPYRPAPGGTDYGRTHFARDANGVASPVVASILQAAIVSGDTGLRAEGLRLLDAMGKWDNGVPRGAQTWEVPLHTPDILASAHMVRAYTYGYELTGDRRYLSRAVYWAWTGVPFVYLKPPTDLAVGLYATIPVLGATSWQAPNWMGLPVQWCGLVYADALYRLQRYDAAGPWRRIADGIAASGVQQSWPQGAGLLSGLLPDSYGLRSETRNAVAINPGTVQACAARLFALPEVFDYAVLRRAGLCALAPGRFVEARQRADGIVLRVAPWHTGGGYVLVSGLSEKPSVAVDGSPVPVGGEGASYADGRLVVRITGPSRLSIRAARGTMGGGD
ncbi:MAG: hypothetical protein IT208_08015 [Chthonomonadales bacterium]|nr:hypothetical protein [Chthonomonadales bacterium]